MLDWQDGQPFSRRFGDIYFSRAGGLDETRHVFLEGNRLAQRFAALAPGAAFAIGETGFGTGLNFLAAWQLFASTAPPTARLHFVSTELDPLAPADLDRALGLWPALERERRELVAQYALPSIGWHRFSLDHGRVHLTLLVGDARETLPALQGALDAWFLDGFAPSRNPELWGVDLLRVVGEKSRAGATVATYSCAGEVRRGLAAAGFRVSKARGYGSKREMLCGERDVAGGMPAATRPRSAIVVGGGLAGAAVSDSLVRRGWQVALLERNADLAGEASGNAQGILYARLSAHHTPLSRLVLAGYQHTLRILRTRLPSDGNAWSDCPVLHLAFDAEEAARQAGLSGVGLPRDLLYPVSQAEAGLIAGLPMESGGLLFPRGGWVHPPALCRALAAHPAIVTHSSRAVVAVHEEGGQWVAADGAGEIARASVAIVAAGAASARFHQTAALPLRVNRGQVTLLPATARSADLRAVLCGDGYVAPARAGMHCAGATFAREAQADVREADQVENLARLGRLSPALMHALGTPCAGSAGVGARAGLRCTSPDYLPLAGPAGEAGLFVSTAHGSRGLITAPLAGEVIAAWLEDEPAPLPRDMMAALSPLRFNRGGERA